MPNTRMKTSLFFISFSPLALMLVAKQLLLHFLYNPNKEPFGLMLTVFFSLWLSIIIISFVNLLIFLRSKINKVDRSFTAIEKQKSFSADYLMAYLVPLVAFDIANIAFFSVFVFLFVFLGVLYVKYNLSRYNIVLDCMKFTACSAKEADKNVMIFIRNYAKCVPENGCATIGVKPLDKGVYIG